jgi:hypothetical protein
MRGMRHSAVLGPVVGNEPLDVLLDVPHLFPAPLGKAYQEVALYGVADSNRRVKVMASARQIFA